MVRLRPFKMSDAKHLLAWIKDERTFAMWCANKFEYPLTEDQLNEYKNKYEEDEFGWILTALNEEGKVIGHLLMRKADYEEQSIHLGFVIVDEKLRGFGHGKEMMEKAVKYAFEILGVNKVTLGVYANNPAAHQCYKKVGFKDMKYHNDFFPYKDEKWGLYEMQIEREIREK